MIIRTHEVFYISKMFKYKCMSKFGPNLEPFGTPAKIFQFLLKVFNDIVFIRRVFKNFSKSFRSFRLIHIVSNILS